MPTISEAIKQAYAEVKSYGVYPVDLRLLVMHDEGLKEQMDVLLKQDQEMKNYPLFLEQVERLKQDEPVEYIINEAQFLGHSLYVDSHVLIPRGETEELIAKLTEKIPHYFDPRNFLVCADVGTGSGAIAIAVKDAFPNWLLIASDISPDALAVAEKNFNASGLTVQTYLGDALDPFIAGKTALDVLICNPPYIAKKEDAQASVRKYEPASALWLDREASVYEKIFKDYKKVKKGALYMAFEISPDLVEWLKKLMAQYLNDYDYEFEEDLNGLIRFLFIDCH